MNTDSQLGERCPACGIVGHGEDVCTLGRQRDDLIRAIRVHREDFMRHKPRHEIDYALWDVVPHG